MLLLLSVIRAHFHDEVNCMLSVIYADCQHEVTYFEYAECYAEHYFSFAVCWYAECCLWWVSFMLIVTVKSIMLLCWHAVSRFWKMSLISLLCLLMLRYLLLCWVELFLIVYRLSVIMPMVIILSAIKLSGINYEYHLCWLWPLGQLYWVLICLVLFCYVSVRWVLFIMSVIYEDSNSEVNCTEHWWPRFYNNECFHSVYHLWWVS